MTTITVDDALDRAGTGAYQRRLLAIFGLVWAADAMQVLAVGFTAASIAATFGLTVPQALQTGTLFFLGMLFGAAGFGRLADRIGRRRVLIATVACDAVFGLLSVFAQDFTVLLLLRFLTGAAVGGTLPVDYAMMAEFLPSRNRGRWLVMLEGFWAVGTLIVALAAWAASLAGVADAWRYIFAVTAFPALIGVGLRFLVPESPLYLLRLGKTSEAKAIVDRILVINGKTQLGADITLVSPPPAASAGIFSADLRKRSLMILAIWFLVSISYYGVFTWMPPRLAGEGFGFVRGYGFLVILALAQIPGYALAAYGVEKWGRRPTLIGFCLLSALGCLLFVLAGNRHTDRRLALDHELRPARHLGRALCLYAGALSHRIAGDRHGRGRRYGPARRPARPVADGVRGGAEFRFCHRHLCRPSARRCRCGLSDRRRDAPGIAGMMPGGSAGPSKVQSALGSGIPVEECRVADWSCRKGAKRWSKTPKAEFRRSSPPPAFMASPETSA